MQVSTTHQTHAGALAHFTELLAQFTHDHQQATARHAAQAAATSGDTVLTETPNLPHRWEGPGHNGQPIEPAPAAPGLVATTAEADERAAPAPTSLFKFAPSGSRSPGGKEPPF